MTKAHIEAYRANRLGTQLSDDVIAWEIEHQPGCAADVPPEVKEELAYLAEEETAERIDMSMAPLSLYDFASSPHGGSWKPLPDHGSEPAIDPRVHIHHSIVGSAAGAWAYFANSTAIESTTIVHKSGFFWQCMSRTEQSDANFHANGFATSHETEDNGNPNTDPWTPQQIDTLVWLALQDAERFNIPKRKAPAWDSSGFGYHSMYPNDWTNVPGKTCPGTVRKPQWHNIVLPRIVSGVEEDVDMTAEEARQLRAIYEALIVPGTTTPEETVNKLFERVRAVEQGMVVPGTTSVGEAYELLFARVRNIENKINELESPQIPGIDLDSFSDMIADKLATRLAE